jgi:hypothetical protein
MLNSAVSRRRRAAAANISSNRFDSRGALYPGEDRASIEQMLGISGRART